MKSLYFLFNIEDNVTQQAKRPKTEKSEDAMDVDEESIADPEFLQVSFDHMYGVCTIQELLFHRIFWKIYPV